MKDQNQPRDQDPIRQPATEVNFDGLVGPTHNYAGLAYGNLASTQHADLVSNPKAAALQGLEKMKLAMELGIPQALLPPHERPNVAMLKTLGFQGSEEKILKQAQKEAPLLFAACYSSSTMWTANAATVTPSKDSNDGRLHFTPANLVTHFHRSQETQMTRHVLQHIFNDSRQFAVHTALPSTLQLSDEGAANHTRLCQNYSSAGIHLFVYGRQAFGKHAWASDEDAPSPTRFPARQTLESQQAVARRHGLDPNHIMFVKQNPKAIDQGVFHNDVISVGNENVFIYHELAFENTNDVIHRLNEMTPFPLHLIPVTDQELSLQESVQTYLFNSQVVTLPEGGMAMIVPEEVRISDRAQAVLNRIIEEDNPIKSRYFVDCRQSMLNGGGPACLRLRVVMNQEERLACNPSIFLTPMLYQHLVGWVNRHYRDRLGSEDLLDPHLLEENKRALDELTQLLQLGNVYSFQ